MHIKVMPGFDVSKRRWMYSIIQPWLNNGIKTPRPKSRGRPRGRANFELFPVTPPFAVKDWSVY